MNYGNGSNNVKDCLLCNDLIDKHTLNLITSNDFTNRLAGNLSQALFNTYKESDDLKSILLEGTLIVRNAQDRNGIMLGAIIAKTKKNQVIKAVALSGDEATSIKIFNIMKDKGELGKDIVRITSLPNGMLYNALGFEINPRFLQRDVVQLALPNPVPPIGICAAPKLISYIMAQNTEHAPDFIKEIHLSEVYFKTNDTKSNYSTNPNEPVESCDTCKKFLPVLLCNKYDFAANPI